MEDGESSSPRHAAPTGLSASPILPAILQRTSAVSQKHQQSSQANVIQLSADSHPGLHAPAALRPTAMSAIPLSNHNQAAAQYSDGPVPLAPHLASGIGRSMSMGGGRPEPLKRKRGRPRKYAEGSTGNISLSLSPRPSAQGPLSPTTEKRRGRPPGSGRKQQLAALGAWIAGSAGQGFTPHVITIATGEDVATKIMSFSQIGPRAVCVLSANGAISNVTLRQPATSGGTVTYEGRFEILSLSGSFLLTEDGGTRSRTGGLSVSLAGPDGRVVGGGVAGLLMAASPVQVVVGSFIAEGRKTPARITTGTTEQAASLSPASVPPLLTPLSTIRPQKSDTSGPKSPSSPPLDQATGGPNIGTVHSQGQGMRHLQSMAWPGTQSMAESRYDTDINISLPGG